jgi:tRNA(Ile2) C34 agmatinyltransferase TiaS
VIGRGYDFKLRVEWKGRAKLEKLLVHSLQLVEGVGAGPQTTTNGCVLVLPDDVDDTLENTYKAWIADGVVRDYFIQLTTGGTDFLSTEDGDLIIGYQKYI